MSHLIHAVLIADSDWHCDMKKILMSILLIVLALPLMPQNIALTKAKPVRMVRAEAGYRLFAKAYVENEMEKWQRKDVNESNLRYRNRVTEHKKKEMIMILEEEAKDKYLQEISKTFVLNMSLKTYDKSAGKMILEESYFGSLDLTVPDTEARGFINSWNEIELMPEYFIIGDTLGLAKVTFSLPDGKSYTYINKSILDSMYMGVPYVLSPVYVVGEKLKNRENGRYVNIDENIPKRAVENKNTWVVIIANENYRYESKVRYAKNDAESFKNYCVKAFGVPKKNIRYIHNATLNDFEMAIKWLSGIAKQYGDKAKILFYYSGHGISSNRTKKSYFVPVDGRFSKPKTCYCVDLFIDNIGAMPVQSAVVFADAGFVTYSKYNDKSANVSRVSIRSNNQLVNGNVVMCLAAQDNNSAFQYEEKKHGMFTYFLLNEIQNNPYEIKLGDLFYDVQSKVKILSLSEYKTMQTPTVIYSPNLRDKWKDIDF